MNRVRDHLFSYSPLAEYPWRIRWAAGNQIGRVETGTIIVQSAEGLESAFSQITDDIDQAVNRLHTGTYNMEPVVVLVDPSG